MGITKKDCQLLFYSKSLGVSFDKTLTLGRLHQYVKKSEVELFMAKYGYAVSIDKVDFVDEYTEPLFRILGATRIDSLDYSDYEQATIIHDLNQPAPSTLMRNFTCVVDGGTIEHVFNFPVAIKSCMNMLEVGGHYVGITPGNNQMGHGFYQFSPELYYRIFSKENGFEMKKMFVTTSGDEDEWYEVADPVAVHSRVMLVNSRPLTLIIIAKKISEQIVFEKSPMQSDYSTSWQITQPLNIPSQSNRRDVIKRIYHKMLPGRLRNVIRNVYDLYHIKKEDTENFGTLNPDHFKKVII